MIKADRDGGKELQCGFAAEVPWIVLNDIEDASRLYRYIRLDGWRGL